MTETMTDTERQPVRYDVADGVATITLNRPEAMNSLDVATKVALRDAVTSAAADRGGHAEYPQSVVTGPWQ